MKVDVILINRNVADVILFDSNGKELDRIPIKSELEFGSDIDKEMEEHSAKQWMYEQLLAEQRRALTMFRDVEVAKFRAHCRTYGKYMLKGMGEKDTVEGRQDAVVTAFSKDVTPDGMKRFAKAAYRGFLLYRYGAAGMKDKEAQEDFNVELDRFFEEMYAYQLDDEDGVWYEDVMEALASEEFRLHSLEAITSSFVSRGFMLRSFVHATMSRHGNIEPMAAKSSELSEKTIGRINNLKDGKEKDQLNQINEERRK